MTSTKPFQMDVMFQPTYLSRSKVVSCVQCRSYEEPDLISLYKDLLSSIQRFLHWISEHSSNRAYLIVHRSLDNLASQSGNSASDRQVVTIF